MDRKSKLLSTLETFFEIWKKIIEAVFDLGGSDEALRDLPDDPSRIRRIARVILNQDRPYCKTDREPEFYAALREDAPFGALVDFLDTVNSLEELDGLTPVLEREGKRDLAEAYREWLTKWPDPQLPEGFRKNCPLLAARLDTPQKIRILLRGAKFRSVTPLLMGEVFEEIIRRHEVDGEQRVIYAHYRDGRWGDALRIVYHTQLEARALTRLALPGTYAAGTSTDEGLYIEWK